MKVRSVVAVGFLSAMAAIGMVNASSSAAADSNQSGLIEERVGHGGTIIISKSTPDCGGMAKGDLVEERIGHGGSIFHSKTTSNCEAMAKGALVEKRIGHGGSVYYKPSDRQVFN